MRRRFWLGGLALAVWILGSPWLEIWAAQGEAPRILVRLALCGALAAILRGMGAADEERRPAEGLPAALLGTVLLLYRVGGQRLPAAQQYVWADAASLGLVLVTLCWLRAAESLLRGRWSWAFDVRRAIGWAAVVLLACAHPYIERALLDWRPKAELWGTVLGLGVSVCSGATLILALRKQRAAGVWLVAAGAVMLLVWAVKNHAAGLQAENMSAVRAWISAATAPQQFSLWVGLLLGGAWALCPDRRSAARSGR